MCQDVRVFAGSQGRVFTTLPCFNFMLPILILLKSEPMAASRVGLRDCLGCGYSVPAKPFTETDLIKRTGRQTSCLHSLDRGLVGSIVSRPTNSHRQMGHLCL